MMNSFLNFINQDIEAKKTLLSSMPINNKTNKRKYNEKIDSIKETYLDYKESVSKYIEAKANSFEIDEPKKDLKLEEKVNKLYYVVSMLNPMNTFLEKLEIDSLLFDMKNYANFSFEELNKIIDNFVSKFDLVGIKLTRDDFDYTYYVNEYMTTFLKTRNDKDNDYTELRETFEKIYWFNPEIMEHIELNFRKLLKKHTKTFEDYISKLQKSLLLDNDLNDYDEAKKKYKELYNQLLKEQEESLYDIVELSKNGTLEIKNYFPDSKYRTSTYETLLIEPPKEEDYDKIYESLEKLKINVLEYRNYTDFISLFDSFKEEYPLNNNTYNGTELKSLETSISEKESQLEKLNNKIFEKDSNKLFDFIKKTAKTPVKELKIESVKLAKEICELYRKLDIERLKSIITPMISGSMLIGDVLKIYSGFNYYRRNTIQKALKLETYDEVISEDNKFMEFAKNPNNVVINGIYLYEESDVPKVITNKYRFENINLLEEELTDNLDILLEKINFTLRVNKIEKSKLSVEKIWFMTQVKSLISKED